MIIRPSFERIMMKQIFILGFALITVSLNAQPIATNPPGYWQQKVKYTMNVDMNVSANKYKGVQKLEYWNNSPDTLDRVFYHLYWNAFQPNSEMDVRSRRQGTVSTRKDRQGNDIPDWDPRVVDRIVNLAEDEIGYQKISSLKMNGRTQQFVYHETILEVKLDRPILPKGKVTFDMEWEAQVPIQVRRSGRDNPYTGVRYTMTQWYPKMVEYDEDGWHPNPYIAREFYGVWGDFDVTINIDKSYVIGGTGYLQNPNSIGHGYQSSTAAVKQIPSASGKLSWRFLAPNVHDFAWAADPEFKHITRQVDGITIHVLYNNIPTRDFFDDLSATAKANYNNDYNTYVKSWDNQWQTIADAAVMVYPFIRKNFGAYAHKQYSFIQGGDGGMEYPMSTMLEGPSLGTAFHEWMHSWYQMMLGTDEARFAWMDEGFTEYATNLVEEYYRYNIVRKQHPSNSPEIRKSDSAAASKLPLYHSANYSGYISLAKSKYEEPLTTHADHFNTNYAYSSAAYNKGAVFMEQLGYIIGAKARDTILLKYYNQWAFRHPDDDDLIRIAEKYSNIELDWYKMYFVNTTKTIDYGIDSLYQSSNGTRIRLRRIGEMPMPIDLKITFKDGSSELHYIPLDLMFGSKRNEDPSIKRADYLPWKWTHPQFEIETTRRLTDIISVEIDPSQRMADLERRNNKIELNW